MGKQEDRVYVDVDPARGGHSQKPAGRAGASQTVALLVMGASEGVGGAKGHDLPGILRGVLGPAEVRSGLYGFPAGPIVNHGRLQGERVGSAGAEVGISSQLLERADADAGKPLSVRKLRDESGRQAGRYPVEVLVWIGGSWLGKALPHGL